MNSNQTKKPRKQQILEAFAYMLEANPSGKITTAALAKQVGVSEAALYRHFPSKTKMFEGLIEFIEEAVFVRSNAIAHDSNISPLDKCEKILSLILIFSAKNPGLTRILTSNALAGETERLHERITKFYERIDTQLKQILRTAELTEGLKFKLPISTSVNIWIAIIEGKMAQFTRSHFRIAPTEQWKEQWACIATNVTTSQLKTNTQSAEPA